MTTAEKVLHEGLRQHPGDWELRTDLLDKISRRGDGEAAAQILGEAPAPPDSEEALARVYEVCTPVAPDAVIAQAVSFIERHPDSATAHMICARIHSGAEDRDGTQRHYDAAIALNEEYRDEEIEAWLAEQADAAQVEVLQVGAEQVETEVEAETPVPAPAVDAVPAPAVSSELVEDEEEDVMPVVPVSLHSRLEATPAPELEHQEAPDPEAVREEALEKTGLVAAGPFEMVDLLKVDVRPSDTKEKLSAMSIAVLVHVIVFFVLTLIVIAYPQPEPPQITMRVGNSDEMSANVDKPEVEKVAKPNPAAQNRTNIISVASTSSVAVPVVIDPIDTLEPIGLGTDFGMSMSFGAEGAGNVSFFGSKANASKVVFVVDSSASMRSSGKTGLTKHELMKKELSKTIKELSGGMQFQIIFFTGPSWFVGEDWKDDKPNWKKSPKGNYWRYKDDKEESIRTEKYRSATPSGIRRTLNEIQDTPIVGGTDWRVPLKMAMKMKPDVIFFMTDGAVGKDPDKPPVVEDVLEFNKRHSNAKINCVCLMVPKAMEDMGEMSKATRGELTLVLEDGTALRGRELEKHMGGAGAPKKKKK